MKKTLWSTKVTDMTVGDVTKWTLWLTAISYGIVGIVIFWSNIWEWVKTKYDNFMKRYFIREVGKRVATEEGLD